MTNKPFTAISLEKLLSLTESRQLEFKRVGDKHGRILETICAFANSDGGLLVIGVGDAKELKPGERPERRLWGIEENAESFDHLQRLVRERFTPPIESNLLNWTDISCILRDGRLGRVVVLHVSKSDKVHSVHGGGTWTRMDSSNGQLSAAEILELSYRRGVKSSEADPLPIDLRLLETATWQTFVTSRGLRNGTFAEQLMRLGLATEANGVVLPRKAAVLLFAAEPGSLLAAHGARADVRVLVYDGKAATPTATPNYRKQPRTVRGPLIEQIDKTVRLVLDEIAQGVTLTGSGFKARHAYPERVVKEAIVNAVIHRDYRLNRDIFIRIFDDSIEVESPGTFLGNITPENIAKAGSRARNPLIASNLREFPNAPNIDAGEGVKAMFAEMNSANLYPPQYRQSTDAAVEHVTLTLLNLERPSAWDEVSDWIDRNGPIGNSKLREIAKIDTLEASRMLKQWVERGLLAAVPDRGRRNAAYIKPTQTLGEAGLFSFSEGFANNDDDLENTQ